MKMKFNALKKVLAVALVITMVFTSGVMVFASETKAPAQVQVQVNGEMMSFTDAVPKMVDNRVMIPFRAILEKLNAKVDYDQAKAVVTATLGEQVISFAVGSTDLNITTGDQKENKKMDVVPFVDNKSNRTYVSTRAIAEGFGYSVGWDNANKTVIIIDFNKIFENANKDFSYLSMPYAVEYDTTKTYKTKGTLNGKINVQTPSVTKEGEQASAPEKMSVGFSGEMTGLQQMMNADISMKMALDMESLMKDQKMTEEEKAMLVPMMDALKNIDMQIKMDDTGIMYMKCPMLSNIMGSLGQNVDADTWYKMDMNAMYKEMGMDYQGLMNISKGFAGNLDVAEMLTKLANSLSSSYTVDTYKESVLLYDIVKEVAGDSAFKTVGNTHTLVIDKTSLASVLTKHSKELNLTAKDMAEFKDMDFSCTIELQEQNSKMKNCKVKFNMQAEGVNVNVDVTGDSFNSTLNMVVEVADLMDMTMDMDVKSEVTTEKVDTTIPKGANVVDYMNMAENMIPAA